MLRCASRQRHAAAPDPVLHQSGHRPDPGTNLAPMLTSLQVLLGTALGGVCYRGGIIQDNEDRPDVVKQGAAEQGGSATAPSGTAA